MSTNAELNQAFQSLRVAYRQSVAPAFKDVQTQVNQGATWSEVGSEIERLRAELDDLYTQILSLLQQAQANDPQDPELITSLERSLNTNRPQNLSVLASTEATARENQAQQEQRESEGQEFEAEATQGPGTASAGDEAAAAAAARDQLVQVPPALPGSISAALPTNVTNALGTATNLVNAFAATPKLPGPTSLTAVQGNAIVTPVGPGVASQPPAGSSTGGGFELSEPQQTYIYKATLCTSTLSRGKFEQELEGVLMIFPPEVFQQQAQPIFRGTQEEGDAGEAEARENWQRIQAQQQTPPGGDQTTGRVSGGTTTDPGQTGSAPVRVDQNLPAAGNVIPSNTAASSPVVTDPQESTTNLAPAQESAPTSDGVSIAPETQQPPRFDFATGYVTEVPPGVTRDPTSGVWLYTQPNGEQVTIVANTNEAMQAWVNAYNTGTTVTFVDYDRQAGWVTKTFDGRRQNIVGPAPDPYAAPAATSETPQSIGRET